MCWICSVARKLKQHYDNTVFQHIQWRFMLIFIPRLFVRSHLAKWKRSLCYALNWMHFHFDCVMIKLMLHGNDTLHCLTGVMLGKLRAIKTNSTCKYHQLLITDKYFQINVSAPAWLVGRVWILMLQSTHTTVNICFNVIVCKPSVYLHRMQYLYLVSISVRFSPPTSTRAKTCCSHCKGLRVRAK